MKQYEVEYDKDSIFLNAVFEIDQEKAEPHMRDVVRFWSGWEQRMKDWHGSLPSAYLSYLAGPLIDACSRIGADKDRVMEVFSWPRHGVEGHVPIDGSHGVTLVKLDYEDDSGYDPSSLYIKELSEST